MFRLYVDNGGMGPESRFVGNIFGNFGKIKMLGIGNLRLEIWEEGNIAVGYLMGMVRERVKKSQKIENELQIYILVLLLHLPLLYPISPNTTTQNLQEIKAPYYELPLLL